MSEENVERLRHAFEQFMATGELSGDFAPDFVWDMSTFRDWPEQQVYPGIEGARQFLEEWRDAWEDWELKVEDMFDAGDDVVAVLRQRGRSKATGLPVDMHFAQVWTLQDGKQLRMRMYASPDEALKATGLRQ